MKPLYTAPRLDVTIYVFKWRILSNIWQKYILFYELL